MPSGTLKRTKATRIKSSAALQPKRTSIGKRMRKTWPMYVFIVPGMLWFLVFAYLPMLGNVVAFQDYSPYRGIMGSDWVGFDNFIALFTDNEFLSSLGNTIFLSVLQIIFAFPAPIILALVLNSILSNKIRRWVQTIVYLPHFLGWVIVISIWGEVLSGTSAVGHWFQAMTGSNYTMMSNPNTFAILVTAQVIWKEVGWGTIIFLAAMTSIPIEEYEAAAIDGANGFQRAWHVTLPGIRSIIVLLLILRMGSVLSVGFEQLIIQQPAVGAAAAEVLDTLVYYRGVQGGDWGFSTAAGLFKGVIGTVLVLLTNWIAKKTTGEGMI